MWQLRREITDRWEQAVLEDAQLNKRCHEKHVPEGWWHIQPRTERSWQAQHEGAITTREKSARQLPDTSSQPTRDPGGRDTAATRSKGRLCTCV